MLVTKTINQEQLLKELGVDGLVQRGDYLWVQLKSSREIELTPPQQAIVNAHVALPIQSRRDKFTELIANLDTTKPSELKAVLLKIAGVENGSGAVVAKVAAKVVASVKASRKT